MILTYLIKYVYVYNISILKLYIQLQVELMVYNSCFPLIVVLMCFKNPFNI